MIRDLIIHEVEKYSGNRDLADRLLMQGDRPFLAWIAHRFCERNAGAPVTQTLDKLAAITGIPSYRVNYAYFSSAIITLHGLKSRKSMRVLRHVLEAHYPYPALWDDLLRFAYRTVMHMAIELLVEDGTPPFVIEERLNVSHRIVYTVRDAWILRYLAAS